MAKTKNNTTKWVIGICIAIALGLGGFWLFKRNNTTDNPEETPVPDDSSPVEPTMTTGTNTPSPSSMAENIATGGIPIPVPITPLQQVKATTSTSGGYASTTKTLTDAQKKSAVIATNSVTPTVLSKLSTAQINTLYNALVSSGKIKA